MCRIALFSKSDLNRRTWCLLVSMPSMHVRSAAHRPSRSVRIPNVGAPARSRTNNALPGLAGDVDERRVDLRRRFLNMLGVAAIGWSRPHVASVDEKAEQDFVAC